MSWEVFSISCTALLRADWRSSRLGFRTTLGMASTMSARNSGGLESILSASLLYLLKIWSLLLMASSDRRVPDGVSKKISRYSTHGFSFFHNLGATDLKILYIQCFNIIMKDKGMKGCLFISFLHKNLGISEKFAQSFEKNFHNHHWNYYLKWIDHWH